MSVYVARKTFIHGGKRYVPGDVVEDFPDSWPRPEAALHTGIIVQKAAPPKPRQPRQPKEAS